MNPIVHKSNNVTFAKPQEMTDEECSSLPATIYQRDGATAIASFWKPTPEELAALNSNGAVMLSLAGRVQIPVCVEVTLDV